MQNRFKIGLLFFGVFLFGMCPLLLMAQKIEHFSNKEGFNQNTINAIQQDKYGFLWYATPNGLIRYDGYTFKTYNRNDENTEGLQSNDIKFLYNDKNGILWIGTDVGINVYVPWLEKFYTVPLSKNYVVSLIKANYEDEIIFLGDNNLHQCQLIDPSKGTFEVKEYLLDSDSYDFTISDFSFYNYNTLILATSNGLKGLKFENDSVSNRFNVESQIDYVSFTNKSITKILKDDSSNKFYVGSSNGFFVTTYESEQFIILKSFGNLNKNDRNNFSIYVNTIYEDLSKSIWVGTQNDGIYQFDSAGEYIKHFEFNPLNEYGITSAYINALYQDEFNILWIGTAQGGVNKLDLAQKAFISYSYNPYDKYSIADNLITSILEDKKGRLWLSGYNRPLFRSTTSVNDKTANELKFENLEDKLQLQENDVVRCIYQDKKGFIWIGSEQSIIVFNPLTNLFKKIRLQEADATEFGFITLVISQVSEDKILIAGTRMIVLENPWPTIQNNITPKFKVNSNFVRISERVRTVLSDKSNSFWIGTNKALYHGKVNGNSIFLDQEYSNNISEAIRLTHNNIFSLHKGTQGEIWVGTFGGGLDKLILDQNEHPVKIEHFSAKNVLPDDAIYGILEDSSEHLWLSTDKGIVKFNVNDNSVNIYDVRDGLPQNNFRQGAYFKGNSGFFYFGGLNGLTLFKPQNITLNTKLPEILITDFLVDNKTVEIGEKLNGKVILSSSITETKSIRIPQQLRNISFNVVVEQTSTPSKNRIAYMLQGFDKDWIEEDIGKTTINYTNLGSGSYDLKIKAANSDGVWSKDIEQVEIEIIPYWYNTWWGYILFFVIIIAVLWGIMVYFLRLEKLKQQLKFEELDKQRIEIVNQGKFRYFTNISHEFRTPLTLIAGPLEQVVQSNKDESQSKYLAIIQKNTKRLLSLVNQLITFRQAEQGFISLNLYKVTLGNLIYSVTEAFENYAIEKNINFFYKVNSHNEAIVIDVEKIERILFNLLSNSFKNTPAYGNISIEADIIGTENNKLIKIDVIDTGKGIPEKDLVNIFERFYQLGNNKENLSGGGIGLAFCKSLVELFQGEITVKSEPNVETRFSILIPSTPSKEYDNTEIETTYKSYIKDWVPLPSEYKAEIENQQEGNETPKHTILIVEDEDDLQIFLKNFLSNQYNVLIAKNGFEALQKIQSQEPDLVISDIMMPKMDGFALCEKIKLNPDTCHIPVLLLTALGDDENLIKGLEFGADEYISKPFSLNHLGLRAKRLIQNSVKLKEHFSKNSLIPDDDIKISTRDKNFLNDIINIIEKNLADSSFGVEELSIELGLSTSHFYRRLKQLTGQVPNVYLRNFRLQRAAELLRSNEGFNVTEVMYRIGIESPSYFSTSFKKLYGLSPSEFLKAEQTIY